VAGRRRRPRDRRDPASWTSIRSSRYRQRGRSASMTAKLPLVCESEAFPRSAVPVGAAASHRTGPARAARPRPNAGLAPSCADRTSCGRPGRLALGPTCLGCEPGHISRQRRRTFRPPHSARIHRSGHSTAQSAMARASRP
jgi:hypothetical protein